MRIKLLGVVLVCVVPIALACGGKGAIDSGGDLFLDGYVSCDPTMDAFDDVFIFEAETAASVVSVEVDVYSGSQRTGTVSLSERGAGNWYQEEYADDLDADCDSFSSMYFEYSVQDAAGNSQTAVVNP